MGRSAIASAESIRLPLGSNGDYITVKAELNAGEALDLAEAPGDKTLAAIMAYLEGWSLTGPNDAPLPYGPAQSVAERRDTLRALKVSVLREIVEVLEPHVTAQQRAVEEKKNDPAQRGRIVTDLALGKFLGMSYYEIRTLPRAVYEVALEDLHAYTERIEREREAVTA